MLEPPTPPPASAGPALPVEWRVEPGLTDYAAAVAAMEARVAAIREGRLPELVWLVEHPPLYTAGTSADPADLLQEVQRVAFDGHVGGGEDAADENAVRVEGGILEDHQVVADNRIGGRLNAVTAAVARMPPAPKHPTTRAAVLSNQPQSKACVRCTGGGGGVTTVPIWVPRLLARKT